MKAWRRRPLRRLSLRVPRFKATTQLLNGKRFDVVSRGAKGVGTLHVADVFGAAEDRDVERRIEVSIPNPGEDFEPAEVRNFQIEENEIGQSRVAATDGRFKLLDCGGAIRGMHDFTIEPALVQRPAKEKGVILGILDKKNKWA